MTYFDHEVYEIANLIKNEFEVDAENSMDKREIQDPDRFGYASVHLVINLSKNRCSFSEYAPYANIPAEIQIRSILQHAWAEIEHDLGYKSLVQVPRHIRRRFSRISSLLELADQEFSGIRHDLSSYTNQVRHQIHQSPDTTLVDADSLMIFCTENTIPTSIDQLLARKKKAKLIKRKPSEALIKALNWHGINTIKKLQDELGQQNPRFECFVERYVADGDFTAFIRGACLHIFCVYLAAHRGGAEEIHRYFEENGIATKDVRKHYADEAMKRYHQACVDAPYIP